MKLSKSLTPTMIAAAFLLSLHPASAQSGASAGSGPGGTTTGQGPGPDGGAPSADRRAAFRERMLKRFDANGDGKLDDAEKAKMKEFMDRRRAEREAQSGGAGPTPGSGQAGGGPGGRRLGGGGRGQWRGQGQGQGQSQPASGANSGANSGENAGGSN